MALYRPYRDGDDLPRKEKLTRINGGYLLNADLTDGRVVALLPTDDSASLSGEGLTTDGTILIQRRRADGSVVASVQLEE